MEESADRKNIAQLKNKRFQKRFCCKTKLTKFKIIKKKNSDHDEIFSTEVQS